jgi:hypothetical protein
VGLMPVSSNMTWGVARTAGPIVDAKFAELRYGEVRRILLPGCEYPGEWLWATPRTGLTLLLGEPKVPRK